MTDAFPDSSPDSEIGDSNGRRRGGLLGETPVLLASGEVRRLDTLCVGDRVITHTGESCTITGTASYDVEDDLVTLFPAYAHPLTMTGDHKVWAARTTTLPARLGADGLRWNARWKDEPLQFIWIRADELREGDFVFVPTPQIAKSSLQELDLAPFATQYDDTTVTWEVICNAPSPISKREIVRQTQTAENAIRFILSGGTSQRLNPRHDRARERIEMYLQQHGSSIATWSSDHKEREHRVASRFVPFTRETLYWIGRWIGDGWLTSYGRGKTYGRLGMAFNSTDREAIAAYEGYMSSLGFPCSKFHHATKQLTQIVTSYGPWVSCMRQLFADYKSKPSTKYVPHVIKLLPVEQIEFVLEGYRDADGHEGTHKYRFATVSRQLAADVKLMFSRVGVPARIKESARTYPHLKLHNRLSITIDTPRYDQTHMRFQYRKLDHGYAVRLNRILCEKRAATVWDVSVPGHASYVTEFAIRSSLGEVRCARTAEMHAR